jgi:RNA polymerase sigma-70 factor (ECF subfamily)
MSLHEASDGEEASAGAGEGVVRPLRFVGDDAAMVQAMRSGHPGAAAAMYDRYARHVYRVLYRIMGFDGQLEDLLQDVFAEAMAGVGSLREADHVKAWLTGIAVHTARGCIRRRSRKSWLQFWKPESLPARAAPVAEQETIEALRAVYAVLDRMPVKERIPFSLRFVEGMELTEVARACGYSLATTKRRLSRAQERFLAQAGRTPELIEWLEGSPRWRQT